MLGRTWKAEIEAWMDVLDLLMCLELKKLMNKKLLQKLLTE
jgi:hypothetical protein